MREPRLYKNVFDNNPSTVVIFFLQIRECCEGFYGPDCLPCPGPIGHPCFGNGEVSYIFFTVIVPWYHCTIRIFKTLAFFAVLEGRWDLQVSPQFSGHGLWTLCREEEVWTELQCKWVCLHAGASSQQGLNRLHWPAVLVPWNNPFYIAW